MSRLRWKPLALAGAATMCIYAPIIISGDDGIGILYWLALLTGILGLVLTAAILIFTKSRRNATTLVGVAAVLVLISITLSRYDYTLRTSYRWTFHSDMYKQQLIAQHGLAPGGITYMDWDGWGFAGVGDTEVYLVHDPSDNLKNAVHAKYGIKAEALPCEVGQIRRLEKDWYSVVFFTNEIWSSGCI